jgi:ligand-binding SRPBCC domain-containing protein
MYYLLKDRFVVAADSAKTWAFFSAAENLPRITPPAMKFRIDAEPAGGIAQDSILDYTVRVAGVPVRWRTLITSWVPPIQFIDLQIRGPYAVWHHRHTFTPVADGMECTDDVLYKLPGGAVGRIAQPLMVRPQLLAIFRFRREAIARLLGPVRAIQADVTIERVS